MNNRTDFKDYNAAIWRAKKEFLKPVKYIENIVFDDLVGIDREDLDYGSLFITVTKPNI